MGITHKHFILGFATLALTASTALAGGFALREQSAEAQGNSFAGVAAGTDGLSSMFWNPATLALHADEGFVSETSASLIIPYSKASTPAPGSGNIGVTTPVPASYMSYAISDRLVLGMGVNAPFGLATKSDMWAGAAQGQKSKVASYDFSPTVGFKISDGISVGAGLQLNYLDVTLTNSHPLLGQFVDVNGNDWGIGFTLGALLQPTETTSIGIGYRSAMKHTLEGSGTTRAPVPLHLTDWDISAPFTSPETVTVGVAQKVGDSLTLKGGIEWTNWSRFKSLDISFAGTPLVLSTHENWKDGWFYSVGGDYDVNDALTLRAGVAYEKSPVPDGWRTVRMPDNDRYWLSMGGSYKLTDRATANLSYSHVFMDKGDKLQGMPATTVFKQRLDILSASLTMDW